MRRKATPYLLAALALLAAGCERHKAETPPQPLGDDPPLRQVYEPPKMPPAQDDFSRRAGIGSTAFCDVYAKLEGFDDWSAKVTDNEISTVNGSVDITFAIGGTSKLEEVVQKSDPLYEQLSALRLGDMVRISGRFAHGNGECVYGGLYAVKVTKLTR